MALPPVWTAWEQRFQLASTSEEVLSALREADELLLKDPSLRHAVTKPRLLQLALAKREQLHAWVAHF